MKNAITVLLLIIGLCKPGFTIAQNPFSRLKAEHWDSKNGMPNDMALNVYQTKDGFIWITGYTGLTRFDGINFTSFNSRTVSLMKTDNIQEVLDETGDSTLWIPTPTSGLLSYKNGKFNAYLTDSTSLSVIGKTPKEELLLSIGRRNGSYVLFDTHSKTYKSVTDSQWLRMVFKDEITLNQWVGVKDKSGDYWIYFKDKFYRYNKGTFNELTPKEGYFPEKDYFQIYADSRNRVWLISSIGLYIWNGKAFGLYPGMENARFVGSGGASTGMILEDRNGGIWVATISGVAYLPAQSDRFIFPQKSNNLLSLNFNNILEDREGNIWFSSTANGLVKLSESKFITYSEQDGLNDNRVAAVCSLDINSYLVCTYLKLFIVDHGVIKPYIFKNKSLANFSGDPTQLFKDSHGNVWLSFTSGNIIRISKTGEKLFHPPGISQARYMFEDNNGQIWFGFAYHGIGFLNKKDEIEMLPLPKIDFSTYFISSIRKLQNGNWLVTSFNKGIIILNKEGIPTYYDDKSGLPTIGVFCSVEDPEGTVWLTTQSGITRFKNGEFRNIDFHSGLPDNSIFEFLPDKLGYVWLPSNKGLIRAKKQELNDYLDKKTDTINWQLYDEGDGLLNRQCVGARHSAITPDGHLLFLTFGGLVEADPGQLKKNMVPPPVNINEVLRDNANIKLNRDQVFSPGNHRYIFSYSALSFVAPEKVQFKFKLEGYDKDWISAIGDRKAFYTNIPSGKYTFRVIASNNDGVWNNAGASYSFTINPFFYETYWFWILSLIFLALIIWMIVKWRTRAVKKQNEILEAVVASRTNDLNKVNSELSQSLDHLKATQSQLIHSEKMASLGELTAGIAHEIQNPLNFVNNFSDVNTELISELFGEFDKRNYDEAKVIANDIRENEQKINHHGKRADAIVKGMLEHSRSSSGQKELTDINALCDEYLRLAYHGLRAKDKSFNAKFETGFDPSLPKINIVPQEIGRVILNLINNAFYAVNERKKLNETGYEPEVIVSTKKERNKVEIKVKDNGIGIPKNIVDKIFQPFFTTKPTGSGTGLGLSLAYDIVKGHGGEIKVETQSGEAAAQAGKEGEARPDDPVGLGSEFIIVLPA